MLPFKRSLCCLERERREREEAKMFLRRITLPLMARVKETTGIVGLDVVPNAREVLIQLYNKTLKEIQAVPEDEGYRKAIESFTRHRLKDCQEQVGWEVIQKRLGCGQVEELIEGAQNELKLIEKMVANIISNKGTGRYTGFGSYYVPAYSTLSAKNRQELNGCKIRVSYANHRPCTPPGGYRGYSTYMSRLYPKSNSSFSLSSGNALRSDVLPLREDMYLVDTGFYSPRICKEDELTRVPAKRGARFENKVGFMGLVAGESLIKEQILERFFIDLVAGDSTMKERATARFNDMVGSIDVVAGEPLLLLPQRFRQKRVWMELRKIWRSNSKVKGFIMEKVRGGYSVGIAGYVTFLPTRPLISQRLSNDRFTIESINSKKSNIVVY